jgi:hypothetical protein
MSTGNRIASATTLNTRVMPLALMPIAAGQSEQLLGTVGEIAVTRSARPVCERSATVRPMTMMSESGAGSAEFAILPICRPPYRAPS